MVTNGRKNGIMEEWKNGEDKRKEKWNHGIMPKQETPKTRRCEDGTKKHKSGIQEASCLE
jgi:hypothetical protein